MLRANVVVSLVIFAALMQCMNGKENITPWIYSMKQPVSCNREHSEIGICLSGIDDDNSKRWKMLEILLDGCESGGYNADK
ncbi:unnamed protein product [Arabidopsis thaliana]|uniref:Uncharacterized protein n=1 Tax=Arabidopsis thaliana TaxID=3702 RepID=A0A5S9XU08_ARATH|nr:unnamed protein product [Arabidopsis thaliana]